MAKSKAPLPSIHRIKQRAKQYKKELSISHNEALLKISEEYGFENWQSFLKELSEKSTSDEIKSEKDRNSVLYENFVTIDAASNFIGERTNDTFLQTEKAVEQIKIESNKKCLTKLGFEFSVFEPTRTGLTKSILDATQQVRTHFELEDFHYFWKQGQGTENKVKGEAFFLTDQKEIASQVSLYRPNSKNGDPRMWFRGLPQFAKSGDQIAIIVRDKTPYLINLSVANISGSFESPSSKIKVFLEASCQGNIARELLDKLKILAKSPYPAMKTGDTAVGFTLETLLGLKQNSSKRPDYKGIELKAGRGNKTRTNLFAQVADWVNSPCKKSADILDKYGYERGDDFKLYCTISTQRQNSQGLHFVYDESKDELQEWYSGSELVAVWSGKVLRERLKEKHAETFWIEAKSELIEGVEYFQLLSVIHTKSPILSQLMPLINSGVITMDHLIKRSTKGVSEKGPLFKINKKDLELLFPEPKKYLLK